MKATACLCVFLMTDSARGLGQSQGGSHLHRYRPSPVHYPELQHHRRHVQGHRDREGNPRPAYGLEGSLLQAGHHRSTNQLNAVEREKAGERCDVRLPREATVTMISIKTPGLFASAPHWVLNISPGQSCHGTAYFPPTVIYNIV